jgi:hypothetical protein
MEKKKAGYAVVSYQEIIEMQPLLAGTSAQKAKLITLIRALTLGKEKKAQYLYQLQICLPGATCSCGHMEGKESHMVGNPQ